MHNLGKSFREDFRRTFELPSNTALPLFFVFLCNEEAIGSWAVGAAFDKRNCEVTLILLFCSRTTVPRAYISTSTRSNSLAHVLVPLDQPDTSDSWPISEPLSLTNAVSKAYYRRVRS